MAELPTPAEITDLAGLLAPGMVILGILSRFSSTRSVELKDKIIAYGFASTAYITAVSPLFDVGWGLVISAWLWSLLKYFVVPVLIGIGAAYLWQAEWLYRIAEKADLRLAHHTPTAWDHAFRRMRRGTYVLVRLKNGREFAGLMGRRSFASTDPAERDLLIQELWRIPEAGPWQRIEPVRAAILCGKDIQSIEMFGGG